MKPALHSLLRACGAIGGLAGMSASWGMAAQVNAPQETEQATGMNSNTQTLYLAAFVDGRDKQTIIRLDRINGTFYIEAGELDAIGIRTKGLVLDAQRRISLDKVPHLHYTYRSDEQTIDFDLPDKALTPESLGYREPPPPAPSSGTGLVLNYAANLQSTRVSYTQRSDGLRTLGPALDGGYYGSAPLMSAQESTSDYNTLNRTLAVGTQFRFFTPIGSFVNSGYATLQDGTTQYTRQDTYWTYSWVDSMITATVGDTVSSSLTWSRSVRLGGFSIESNFAVRPDLVTFPVPALGGSAVVPTTVDLYINGLRQFSGLATGGPFIIDTPPALTGAGNASLVYRDELGREVTVNQMLYVDQRLLTPGLSEWSFEAGYPRFSYGSRSFDYASSPVANGSWRYGASDVFTLESHAEVAHGLEDAGIGGLLQIGHWGVFNGSATLSEGDTHGTQASFGYQYNSPHFGFVLQGIRAYGGYRDIGNLESVDVPKRQLHASISVPFGAAQSVSLNYARQDASILGGSRIVSLGYNGSFGSHVSLFGTLFKDRDVPDSGGIYLGLILSFDNRLSISTSASSYGDTKTMSVSAGQSVDYDKGGFGWNVLGDGGNGGYRHEMGRLDYQGTYANLSVQLEHSQSSVIDYSDRSLYASGSLVFMDGALLASRPISDAFAVVSTDGTPDVPVLRENRLVGTTNSGGHLLIPDLISYEDNHLSIDTLNLPVEASIETDHLEVAPRAQSGVLARFPVGRYQGATVILQDEQGKPLPVGTLVTVPGSSEPNQVGYDGEVFFPVLQPGGNKVSARVGDVLCSADIRFTPADTMKTIGPFACKRTSKP